MSEHASAADRPNQVERTDVRSDAVIGTLAAVVVATFVASGAMFLVFVLLTRTDAPDRSLFGGSSGHVTVPPPPRLVGSAGDRYRAEDFTADPRIQRELTPEMLNMELSRPAKLRAVYEYAKRRELSTYAPRPDGRYRIPIARAKALLLEQSADGTLR